MDLPDSVEAIKFEMEQKGLTAKDLEPMITKRNRVYEVLNRKRSLTINMIWLLHQELGIPAEALIKECERNNFPIWRRMIDRIQGATTGA